MRQSGVPAEIQSGVFLHFQFLHFLINLFMSIIKSAMLYIQARPIEEILISIYIISLVSEYLIAKITKTKIHQLKETIANFVIGFLSFIIDFLFTIITLPVLWYLFNHVKLIEINPDSILSFCTLFILIDFVEYWFHRLSHQVNLLWAAHVVHHQSEFFNLSVGLRTSFFVPLFNIFFYLLFPILGFSPNMILMIIFIQGIYQLLIHTELIGKLGILEYILVTPSAHRVHHGSNAIYIDKNYGKFLICWDMLFHTYQKEIEEVVYGLTKPMENKCIVASIISPYNKLIKTYQKMGARKYRIAVLFKKPDIVEEIYNSIFKKE